MFYKKSTNTTFILFACICVSICAKANDISSSSSIKFIIDAEHNQVSYPIYIHLPEEYREDGDMRYPVLYILDAEWHFSIVSKIARLKSKPIIIVGVGNSDSNVMGQRIIDYRMPGALAYYNFLTEKIIPFVDAHYLTNHSSRSLMGHRLGGLFTGLAVLLENPTERYFKRYISHDGSFLDQPLIIDDMESQLFSVSSRLPVQVIVGGALLDNGNGRYAKQFYQLLRIRDYESIDLQYWPYSVGSQESLLAAITDVLEKFY